jgi:hypothetical protein
LQYSAGRVIFMSAARCVNLIVGSQRTDEGSPTGAGFEDHPRGLERGDQCSRQPWRRLEIVVTAPPWSQYRAFLAHSLQVADRVAFVSTLNHLWTKSRRELVKGTGFGIERIVEFAAPREWPSTGFQLGIVMLTRGYDGPCTVDTL